MVKSFKDGRFYQVAKKDARLLTKEMVENLTNGASTTLRSALEKATNMMERRELPPGWDWDFLVGNKIPHVRVVFAIFSRLNNCNNTKLFLSS